ncbi:MAG: 8-oxo-dGDP phosphatase [Actinomycetota bacterium]|nr:8-oxo-dGDP phosphatase [Actinomycetota bacterium]
MTSGPDDELTDVAVDRVVVSSTLRLHGKVWDVRTDVVELGDGQRVERDVLVHPGAVGIVAVDDELRVLLVRQYRHPVAAMLWEPPAGLLDVAGEDPLDAAKRELFEEAGYRARDWTVLIDAFTSPGGSSESVRLYLARGLQPVGDDERHVGDGEERDMPTRWVPLSEVRAAVLSGRLHSPLGAMGFLAAASVLLDGVAVPRGAGSPWMRSGTPAN